MIFFYMKDYLESENVFVIVSLVKTLKYILYLSLGMKIMSIKYLVSFNNYLLNLLIAFFGD